MKRWLIVLSSFATALTLWAVVVHSCGPGYTFRAYLDKRFWQPLSKYEDSLGKQPSQSEARKEYGPFAGMSDSGANESLRKARVSYRTLQFADARAAVETGLQENPGESEKEELLLIDAKVDLREGEGSTQKPQTGKKRKHPHGASRDTDSHSGAGASKEELLSRSEEKFRDFIGKSQSPAFRSEARGWLARVCYLTKDYPSAAKIYLDELAKEDSVFSRESLIASLRMIFPYNGSSARLVDHLEEYFDTPAHALFVVNLVTNPVYSSPEERASMAVVAQKTIEALRKRHDLFAPGSDSEALVLALMRASLYMGDTRSALAYSQWVSEKSETAGKPEFNWMKAACCYLQHDFKAAEAPLLRMYHAKEANFRDKSTATLALLGVYQKLGLTVDQLHAAFLYYQAEQYRPPESSREGEDDYLTGPYFDFHYLPAAGWLFDLPYLLDVQLKDEELLSYLKRYAKQAKLITVNSFSIRHRTAYEMVEYALAVRYSRQEKYDKAASIYERLKAAPRAHRLRHLARLHAEAGNPALTSGQSLDAQFAYAAFLEEHSTQVFFNDMVWSGFQRYAYLTTKLNSPCTDYYPGNDPDCQGLTGAERESFLKKERKIKDEQEERWRAYKILDKVREKAGRSELGNRAAARALKCLKLINTERFGRQEEIDSGIRRLSNWTEK
jgi:hypothetical protein